MTDHASKLRDFRATEHFSKIAAEIISDGRTFLGYDRLYTLWQCVEGLRYIDYPVRVVEVGVFRGGSAKFILKALEHFNIANEFHIFDTFKGHVQVDAQLDRYHEIGNLSKTSVDEVAEYIGSGEVNIYEGDFMETSSNIMCLPQFSLIHIDVDLYEPTRYSLEFFGRRTVPGSIFVVDDYLNTHCEGVAKAVDDFISYKFRMIRLLTGQALLVKIK